MIYFERVGQVLRVAQEIKSPSVYLDHWALREISESDELACRFSRFLRSHGGTLVLSWLNVVEFCKVADAAQRRKADLLIHGLFPNLFWLNPDFFTVEKNERMSGTQQLLPCLPHSDLDLAYTYVRIALRNSVKPRSLRSQNIFTAIHSIPDIPKQYDELADLIVSQIEWLRTRYENTKAMQAKLRALPKRQVISRGT